MFLPLLFFTSCQKTDLPGPTQQNSISELNADSISFTEMLRSHKSGSLSTRDAITYTMPDAINNIETFFSFHYGDYDVQTSDKYDYTDTITVSYASLPMSEAEVAAFTEQVRLEGADQLSRIPGTAQKYFYLISLNPISVSTTTAQIEVHSYFGKNALSWVDPNPPITPTFSIPYALDIDNYGSCTDKNNTAILGAARRIGVDVNAVLPALANNGIAWYQKLYFTAQIVLTGTSRSFGSSPAWNIMDEKFKAKNPSDITPDDCDMDYRVFRKLHNCGGNYCSYSCNETCIDNDLYNYYGQSVYQILIESRNQISRNFIFYFYTVMDQERGSYEDDVQWKGSATFVNAYFDDTRKKLAFPTPIYE